MDRYQVLAYNQGALCVERVEVEAESGESAAEPAEGAAEETKA